MAPPLLPRMGPSPAPAEEDATAVAAATAAAASASGSRRRGRRSLISWRSVFCFACRREGSLQDQEAFAAGTPWQWQRSRRRKRTVPVDGDLVATTADPEEATIRALPGSEANAPSEAPAPSRAHRAEQPRAAPAETTTKASAREPCTKAPAGRGGAGAFGPVVGLSVVAAVSMAGLLGGRVWAVACVCAWLAALSWLRQRNAPAAGYATAGSDGGSGGGG
ncbi:hypothetical protein BS78_01G197800 [Paspalum vaginatum]|nr:hypothetical protein BS78_01G197800 [Paspalum vaginatum]